MTGLLNYSPSQEIRFAVVLYGGVSLAIYMNGIVQELLRMVRGTANLPSGEELKGTERVYRRIGQILRPGPADEAWGGLEIDPEDLHRYPIQTRFVVDIISGSSAGGINGVALAKALALRCRSMDVLKNTWLEKAQLDSLLNDKMFSRFRRQTTSLLDSEYMYKTIFETLSEFNAEDQSTPSAGAFADQIDLFVTATDLNGLYAPIQLADAMIEERIHRAVLHFQYVSTEMREALGLASNPEDTPNHFTRDYDPMLAFAARCTSSFPVAFEPMTFEKIEPAVRAQRRTLHEAKRRFGEFFSAYRAQGAGFHFDADGEQRTGSASEIALEERPFADGGALDNRPFSYAIDLIQYRPATRPVQRKLLFVDPFPEYAEDNRGRVEIGFIDNARLSALTLPRYETIRGDIDRINDCNRRQDRLDALRDRMEYDEKILRERLKTDVHRPNAPQNFQDLYLEDLLGTYGYPESYRPYHHLRVQSVTGDFALTLTRVCGFNPDSDEEYFIRLLVRAWREAHFSACRDKDKEPENAFLYRFDVDFRLRRIDYLVQVIDRRLCQRPEDFEGDMTLLLASVPEDKLLQVRMPIERELARLRDAYRKLGSRRRSPLLESAVHLRSYLEPHFRTVMETSDRKKRYAEAEKIYAQYKDDIDELMEQARNYYGTAFADSSREMSHVLNPPDNIASTMNEEELKLRKLLYDEYYCFHWYDMLSLPFLDGSIAKENARIEVYRVSPADSRLKPESTRGDKKLAGTAAAAFGGFLERAWRENDIMWGRLDGAERIITALLPGRENEKVRQRYIDEAQKTILTEELSPESSKSIFRWLAQKLRKELGSDMTVDKIISRGNEILARTPPLQQLVSNAEFKTFIEKYYEIPDPPPPARVTAWSSRALKILSRMIEDAPDSNIRREVSGRLASSLRWSGVLLSQLATFATPGRLGWRLAEYWLSLLALGAILLILVAPLIGVAGVAYVGYATLAGALALWVVQHAFGRVFRRQSPFRDLVVVLAVLLLLFLLAVGAITAGAYVYNHAFLWSRNP
jgi:patatin-related protein